MPVLWTGKWEFPYFCDLEKFRKLDHPTVKFLHFFLRTSFSTTRARWNKKQNEGNFVFSGYQVEIAFAWNYAASL
jgi:hypothetical protein